ncbi:MAG: adenylate/guanylate cyclase domain-containing protein [Verrucomicrobiae bacterium]
MKLRGGTPGFSTPAAEKTRNLTRGAFPPNGNGIKKTRRIRAEHSFRKLFFSLRFSLGTAFVGIAVLTSLLLGFSTYFSVRAFIREGIRERLRDAAGIAALQMDADRHRGLVRRSDEAGDAYLSLKRSLQAIRERAKEIRYIYTLRKDGAGKIHFVLDAEEAEENVSHIGDVVDATSPAMLAAFEPPYRVQIDSRFYTDKWGTWLSSYAPIFSSGGELEGVLGIDMSATQITDYEQTYLATTVLLALGASLAVAALGIAFSRRISRPLLRLAAEMSRIQSFDLDHRPRIDSRVKEIAAMAEALVNMKNGLRSFRKYVPADLVAELMRLNKEAVLGAEKRTMTVMFSDIADFTALSEQMAPEILAGHLGVYFEGMTKIILRNCGTVDKYIGDAIMSFWGAPNPAPDHAAAACRTALQCRRFLESLEMESARKGEPVFRTRIGINSGEMIVGNMGYDERMNYTVIGDNVNLASRLEGLNKIYGTQILISEQTHSLVEGKFETRRIDDVTVKGRSQSVAVYELISEKEKPLPAGGCGEGQM